MNLRLAVVVVVVVAAASNTVHVVPDQGAGHEHANILALLKQVPPFLHGMEEQRLTAFQKRKCQLEFIRELLE